MKETVYSGYNQVTGNRICTYLKDREIPCSVTLKNPVRCVYVRNKTIIKVKGGALTDANRAEIQAIIDSSVEY